MESIANTVPVQSSVASGVRCEQKIIEGDCLEVMRGFADKSFDLVLTDPPYGTTQNNWDTVVPLDLMWDELKRITKDTGVFCITAQTPFDKVLGASNISRLKYEWIYEKPMATGHLNALIAPMKAHENILIFYSGSPTYNPQMTKGKPYKGISGRQSTNYGKHKSVLSDNKGVRYPKSIIRFPSDNTKYHPTQKPLELFKYLIATYSNEGDTILDPFMGSGTTLVAAKYLNRNATGIEISPKYCEIARNRLSQQQLF